MVHPTRISLRSGLLAASAIVLVTGQGAAMAQDAPSADRPVTSQDQPGTQGSPSAAQQPASKNGVSPPVAGRPQDASAGPASSNEIVITVFAPRCCRR